MGCRSDYMEGSEDDGPRAELALVSRAIHALAHGSYPSKGKYLLAMVDLLTDAACRMAETYVNASVAVPSNALDWYKRHKERDLRAAREAIARLEATMSEQQKKIYEDMAVHKRVLAKYGENK